MTSGNSRHPDLARDAVAIPQSHATWTNLRWPLVLAGLGVLALAIDVQVCRWLVYEKRLGKVSAVLEDVELFGHGLIATLVVLGVAVASPRVRAAVPRALTAMLGAGLLADVLKMCVARCRPFEHPQNASVWDSFRALFPGNTAGSVGQSFPSAHCATAFGLALALGTMFPKGRWFFLALAGAVAIERVDTGAHFVSDSLWGCAIGSAVYLLVYGRTGVSRFFDRKESAWSGTASLPEQADEVPARPAAQSAAARQAPSIKLAAHFAEPIRSLSVVIPMFNEEENVERAYQALVPPLEPMGLPFELIFVDDGSRDQTGEFLHDLARRDRRVRVVQFRRNFGQTAAMSAGMQHATGDAVVLIDGDLQNDPTDIPMMIARLEEGFDLVHGWRKNRQDRFIDRKLPSLLANKLISYSTGFPIHDLGCTLKAMRRDIAHDLRLYGEMHRFIPIFAHARGARCVEVVTKHHARQFGQSKYGISRTFRVVLDLLTVKFLTQYFFSPMKIFGNLGLVSVALGCVCGGAVVAMKLLAGMDMTGNPLLLGGVFSTMLGIQFFCLGALGEVAVRTYFESQQRTTYAVRRRLNFDDASAAPAARAA